MKVHVTNNWLRKVLFVFCLSLVSGYGFADIASTGYVDSAISTKANTSDLKAVATTGSYNDLTSKPTIPAAANNATLTIQRNGEVVGTFSADASVPATIDITDSDTTYSAGTGISVNGTTITNTAISQVRSGGSTATTLVDIWLE